ncbi:hypothetical protein GLOTRDRAFT_39838 [Gloeophyllum trabeum ATCC 11539]|uniref:Chromo domain-containing protein n=1 Tax=Gloeophyllum trabeum (strain ATCC 11539 / FP-39264 / Madison 617) TaxID=670483 RepID=S7QA51_GLOTA|nr:uncharacterized protein GLOTRDRAFT_39838 [Gloeophyllum trabeum ATCC 11539]EPQ56791.1 hypothetical protein GLOTRDRAFT_39838 [Gloeophyllum trabeum ATCC 11539]
MPKARAEPEDDVEVGDEQEENGDEEEEEYEIEAILDHQHGRFEAGKMGYFVKWKGYDASENSWITEEDAQNAKQAIDEYWDRQKKKNKGGRKSDVKPKPATKKSRDETPEEDPSTSAKKKRRTSKAVSDDEMDVDEVAPPKKPAKTTKPATPTKQTKKKPPVSEDEPEDDDGYFNMSKHYNDPSWEPLLGKIDTIEKQKNGLVVYFTL